jgi:hypothetical protein
MPTRSMPSKTADSYKHVLYSLHHAMLCASVNQIVYQDRERIVVEEKIVEKLISMVPEGLQERADQADALETYSKAVEEQRNRMGVELEAKDDEITRERQARAALAAKLESLQHQVIGMASSSKKRRRRKPDTTTTATTDSTTAGTTGSSTSNEGTSSSKPGSADASSGLLSPTAAESGVECEDDAEMVVAQQAQEARRLAAKLRQKRRKEVLLRAEQARIEAEKDELGLAVGVAEEEKAKLKRQKKKLDRKLAEARGEIEDLQADVTRERTALMDTVREQNRELQLWEQVVRLVLSTKEINSIWERSEYNEEEELWVLPPKLVNKLKNSFQGGTDGYRLPQIGNASNSNSTADVTSASSDRESGSADKDKRRKHREPSPDTYSTANGSSSDHRDVSDGSSKRGSKPPKQDRGSSARPARTSVSGASSDDAVHSGSEDATSQQYQQQQQKSSPRSRETIAITNSISTGSSSNSSSKRRPSSMLSREVDVSVADSTADTATDTSNTTSATSSSSSRHANRARSRAGSRSESRTPQANISNSSSNSNSNSSSVILEQNSSSVGIGTVQEWGFVGGFSSADVTADVSLSPAVRAQDAARCSSRQGGGRRGMSTDSGSTNNNAKPPTLVMKGSASAQTVTTNGVTDDGDGASPDDIRREKKERKRKEKQQSSSSNIAVAEADSSSGNSKYASMLQDHVWAPAGEDDAYDYEIGNTPSQRSNQAVAA